MARELLIQGERACMASKACASPSLRRFTALLGAVQRQRYLSREKTMRRLDPVHDPRFSAGAFEGMLVRDQEPT